MRIFLVLILLAVISCSEEPSLIPFYNSPDFTAEWISKDSKAYKDIHKIDFFQFKNQDGNIISNKSLEGKIYTANFFFTTCPSICPQMTNNLIDTHNKFKDEPNFKQLSFTVMPWVDTVEKLNQYSINNGLDSNQWYLLTGDKTSIYDLARQSFFAEKRIGLQKNSDEFLHTENVLLIDSQGRMRGVYNATLSSEINRMNQDIEVLLKEL